jgi:hypothetical protein
VWGKLFSGLKNTFGSSPVAPGPRMARIHATNAAWDKAGNWGVAALGVGALAGWGASQSAGVDPQAMGQAGGAAAAGVGAVAGLGILAILAAPLAGRLGGAAIRGIGKKAMGLPGSFVKTMGGSTVPGTFRAADLLIGGARAAVKPLASLEQYIARPLLTGRGPASDAIDAWFPKYRYTPAHDLSRYGLNPVIARRLLGASVGIMGLSAAGEAGRMGGYLPYQAPPPSIYHDGMNVRHTGDGGVDAGYGRSIMGSSSALSDISRARHSMITGR